MAENQGLLNELKSLLKRKRSKQWYAEQLKITLSEVNELLKEMRGKNVDEGEQFLDSEPTHSKEFEQALRKVSNDKGTIESTITLDFEPKSDIELAELHKIDLEKYIITNYWSKVLPTGKFTSSIFSKRKGPEDYTADDFSKFLENYKSNYIPISSPKLDNDKSLVDIELSLSDYHLGKRYVDGDNDPETRATRFVHIAEALTHKVRSVYDINKVVFPISNDFFHTDNYQNTTTNGTPQDIILDYASEYEMGFNILVDTIKMLKTNSKHVEVILVQGNHDRTKSYYLAHALDIFFKNDKNISFVREEGLIKATVVGSTFIGFHHGNCKIDALPLLFATHPVYSKWFGDATYREVHTGDKHHYMAKEIKGVRIQQMPSLSGTDRWHKDNNFVHSVRAALALVYDFKVGKVAEFEERI
jgi:hypothetical protein|tara:strand:+ start:32164 stop:33411 length:1248 start_codon:yes stop_codon:yes gene_type:complete